MRSVWRKLNRLKYFGHVNRICADKVPKRTFAIKEKKVDIILDVTERNADRIIPSYCHLPVSRISLVDRCDSLGSCKPHFFFNY
jgi:hypothetical protein